MSLIFYPAGCDEDLLAHICDPCPDVEGGRIRGIAFVHKTFAFSNPSTAAEWEQGVVDGKIIVIPETHGTFDGGTAQFGPGFGDVPESYLGSEFTLNYFDPNYIGNCDFYNTIRKSRSWKVAYVTETQVHVSSVASTVYGKAPVADDLNSQVVWEVQVKFSQENSPCNYDKPEGIFRCFEVQP